ncbi:MAG: PilN domain-containing protein [Candidatus Omnitrophica bacterium]|nr:PilN domain-containing protein [Candidatus Omnitrophota bacterium]MDD5653447.1 PilN domain-containing protein [Candidatus Omnitrophota bacterium]
MIEINLLPEELRLKAKAGASFSLKDMDPKKILYLIPAVLGLLIIVHLYLAGLTIFQSMRLAGLNRQWAKLEPERKKLENVQKEFNVSTADSQFLQQLLNTRVTWADKLNALSRDLPSGIWFEELIVSDRAFSLRGSVVSTAKVEMNLVNKFMDNLKNDANFSRDFSSLELGSINRREIAVFDIMDFILEGNIKVK